MDYLLSGVGRRLAQPIVLRLRNATLEGALCDAREVLQRHPACDCVEIFADGQFVDEVDRATPSPRYAWPQGLSLH